MKPAPRVAVLISLAVLACAAAEPVTISVDARQPGSAIPNNALGLSFETSLVLPGGRGVHYFRRDNQPLVALFKTLGVKSLRIGGNSVDAPGIPIPSPADLAALFEFAEAAGVKVIYSVRLQDGQPDSAALAARFIHDHYPSAIETLAIGNEPGYYKDYDIYRAKWSAIRDAIVSVFPQVRFSGPDQNPAPELCRKMVHDFGGAAPGSLVEITVHNYPFGCAYRNPSEHDAAKLIPVDAAAGREKMLAPAAYGTYDKILRGIAEAVSGAPVSFRLTETNSFWFSGLEGASDRYASALWAVDYLHWWTSHGASGLSFHTGDRTGGAISLPCRYAAFVSSSKGYEVRPLAYGMKLFDLGSHGKVLPVSLSGADRGLVAYAILREDNTVVVTIIDKSHGEAAASQDVQLKLGKPLAAAKAQAIFLTAADGDIAAGSSVVTLGGAPIGEDGSWNGHWTPLPVTAAADAITVTIPPASAAVVRIAP